MNHILIPAFLINISLLLIRVLIAIAFVVASMNKSKNIKKFAKENGLPVPIGVFVMVAEMAGGLGIFFGVLSQIAAIGLMVLMLGSLRLHIFVWKSKYWASSGGWEYDLMLFALCLVIAISGPGLISLMPIF